MADRQYSEDLAFEQDEKNLIKYYFYKGFDYNDILAFLSTYHNIEISKRTLERRLQQYELRRKNPEYDIAVITNEVQRILDGPGCIPGYRHLWHTLQLKGYQVPRIVVQLLLRELDPEGSERRRQHKLKRRVYRNPGPNAVWHADGYDKLKPYGFAIHGCIDGWSRKLLWLFVTRSNNSPDNIASYYLEAVDKFGGCPMELVTDLGTENGKMAAMQTFFCNNEGAHRYVGSPRNQRIEAYWSMYRKTQSSWWINFFRDLVDHGRFNTSNEFERNCIWFCFAHLIQQDLSEACEHWNSHRIRKSRHYTNDGRPDVLYYLPENHGGEPNLIVQAEEEKKVYARNHLLDIETNHDHFDYIEYVMASQGLVNPQNWREALDMFENIVLISRNGQAGQVND